MRVLWVLLFFGALAAVVMADSESSLEGFSDEELVEISEREPEPLDEDEAGDEENEEGGHGMCRQYDDEGNEEERNRPDLSGVEIQKEIEDKDNEEEDEDENKDDNENYELGKGHHHHHHRRPNHHKVRPHGHHGRRRPHHRHHHHRHHHQHHRHHGHRRHGKRGKRGMCRRQFCGCKKRAGKNCREIIRCFMRMAGCVRRRKCHMRPPHRPHLEGLERQEDSIPVVNSPTSGRPHCPKQKCKKEFKECINSTAKFDCRAKLKCIFKLKHCLRGGNRTGNWSEERLEPFPTPEDSEELDIFQDDELVEVSEEESILDEDRHGNHSRHGFCRNEFKRCLNRTGDDCKKKFMCFTRMAHCVRCFRGRHHHGSWHGKTDFNRPKGITKLKPWVKGGFKKAGALDQFNRPWAMGVFKRPGSINRFNQNWRKGTNRGGLGHLNKPWISGVFKKPMAIKKPWTNVDLRRPFVADIRKKKMKMFKNRRDRKPRNSIRSWEHQIISWGSKAISGYLRPWQRYLQHPRPQPHPSGRPNPPKKCKLELEGCLKKAGKDCKLKFKCYFAFKSCLKHRMRPALGHY